MSNKIYDYRKIISIPYWDLEMLSYAQLTNIIKYNLPDNKSLEDVVFDFEDKSYYDDNDGVHFKFNLDVLVKI